MFWSFVKYVGYALIKAHRKNVLMGCRCQMDNDDEVRDRATYFKAILEQHEASLNSQYILNGIQVS